MTDLELKTLVALIEEKELAHYENRSDFGDIQAEYHGEVARYGDAWVGSHLQLQRARQALDNERSEIQDLRAKLPPVHTCEYRLTVFGDECPF